MCLINFHLGDHSNYKLIMAANRDEFYRRPTAPAGFWEDQPHILAGQDLEGMGTWLGITKSGRIAALTNYRDPNEEQHNKKSRGHIVRNFLESSTPAADFLTSLQQENRSYGGFNLIAGHPDQLYYCNNIHDDLYPVTAGTHALSNAFLDTPWPKTVKGKKELKNYITNNRTLSIDALFTILSDAEEAGDDWLPDTGVGLELERRLSPLFIKTPEYGTRCSTILLVDKQHNVTFVERTYQKGVFETENRFSFQLS
ncbi:NRDE family protein [Lentibacillus juripiscarius]|uniref:NRDE family protein n=1 Tax=Lentibacillus juripiscarius TaxID=257446 RepID=A0ABW5V836_9BACI